MDLRSFQSHQPRSLARLLKLDRDPVTWSPTDLAAIFQHQLRAPLEFDLDDLATRQHQSIQAMTRVDKGGELRSFGDVLRHPRPPIELLLLIKDFAKAAGEREGSIPREVATVLYYMALAVALVRSNQRITSLADAAMKQGISWALHQPWLDEPSKAVLNEGLARLGGAT